MKPSKAAPKPDISAATMSLLVISEILVNLAETAREDDGTLPATWVGWLGERISDATAEISAAVDRAR